MKGPFGQRSNAGPITADCSLHFDDQVDFHGDIERKRRSAEGGAGVFSFFAEKFHQQIRRTIDHLWVTVEIRV